MIDTVTRRTFLEYALATAVVPLLAACSRGAPQAAAAPTTAPAVGTSVTRVSYAYANPNGLHFVATVGGEKPELPHKFGIEFDLLTTTNSPNAVSLSADRSMSPQRRLTPPGQRKTRPQTSNSSSRSQTGRRTYCWRSPRSRRPLS